MKRRTVFITVASFSAALLIFSQAVAAQQTNAPAPQCVPAAQEVPGGGGARGAAGARQGQPAAARGQAAQAPVPRDATITAIPGVVAAGAKWTKIWQQAGNSADGIIPDKDGNVLVAQEDYDAVLKIDPNGKASVFVPGAKGLGSIAMDRQGRLYGAHRTERPGSTKPDRDSIINAISILTPNGKVLADKWTDGKALTVRPNDLAADGQGGVYFTSGCLYYATSKGVSVAAEDLRTNGIVFSPDDKILYVTNGGSVVAFDVKGPGMLANRRDFAKLDGGGGDGSAVDTEGRLYVTTRSGVQVLDKTGKSLGIIPTPRDPISVAFAGSGKKTLFIVGSGAEDANGQPIREGPQQTAATIYKLPMIAEGVKGRAK